LVELYYSDLELSKKHEQFFIMIMENGKSSGGKILDQEKENLSIENMQKFLDFLVNFIIKKKNIVKVSWKVLE
jgi:hypothetical protein